MRLYTTIAEQLIKEMQNKLSDLPETPTSREIVRQDLEKLKSSLAKRGILYQ